MKDSGGGGVDYTLGLIVMMNNGESSSLAVSPTQCSHERMGQLSITMQHIEKETPTISHHNSRQTLTHHSLFLAPASSAYFPLGESLLLEYQQVGRMTG